MLIPSTPTRLVCFGLFAFMLSCSKDDEPVVKTNEELYINEVYPSSGDDWVELFNNNQAAKDISGYLIYDDGSNEYALPAGTVIPAKGFLILYCDDLGTGLHTNFKLSSNGENIWLENKSGKVVDRVEFPFLMDGQSYGRYPDGSENFHISGNATQGISNGDIQAPLIKKVSRTPLVPSLTENVSVVTELFSTVGITAVTLYYRVNNGSFTAATMTLNGTAYTGTIPALNTTGQVDYYVEVSNGEKKSFDPFDAPLNIYSYVLNTDPLPQLRINEFMAVNASCCPDTDSGVPEYDDWIEIYNAGSTAVDIGGFYVSDDLSNPFNSKIAIINPGKTTIQPGGFILIWADGSKSQGELHADFKLSSTGEAVAIYYKDGRTIDAYSFGPQTENVSWGLATNGGATWKAFSTPTPSQPNQ